MKVKICGEKRQVWLEETNDGVDLCVEDFRSHTCVARLTKKGELVLYRDAANFLNRESHTGCIVTRKEFD